MPNIDDLEKCLNNIFNKQNTYLKSNKEFLSVWHNKVFFFICMIKFHQSKLGNARHLTTEYIWRTKMHQILWMTSLSIHVYVNILRKTPGKIIYSLSYRISYFSCIFVLGHLLNIAAWMVSQISSYTSNKVEPLVIFFKYTSFNAMPVCTSNA